MRRSAGRLKASALITVIGTLGLTVGVYRFAVAEEVPQSNYRAYIINNQVAYCYQSACTNGPCCFM
jgi:hypothetical protein